MPQNNSTCEDMAPTYFVRHYGFLSNEIAESPDYTSIQNYDKSVRFAWAIDPNYECGFLYINGIYHVYISLPRMNEPCEPITVVKMQKLGKSETVPEELNALVRVEDYKNHTDKGVVNHIPLCNEWGLLYENGKVVKILVSPDNVENMVYHKYLENLKYKSDEKSDKLKDTGNRTNLGGTGGLRDINPENGRCDLLPASAILELMSSDALYNDCANKPILMVALRDIMAWIEYRDINDLCMAIYQLTLQNTLNISGELKSSEFCLAQGLLDLSIHYRKGAEKYAVRNWEKGLPIHSFIDSAIRHLCKEIMGWTDEPHLIACMWNLFGVLWTLRHHPELDDMPKYHDKECEINNENT